MNLEQVPVDIRLSTPWGEKKVSRVAPGAAVHPAFATGSSAAPASTATVAGYLLQGGVPSYQRRSLPTAAVSCS